MSSSEAPPAPYVISTAAQLRTILQENPQAITTARSLWLADLSDDLIHVGGWSAFTWPDDGVAPSEERIEPWYAVFTLLVERTEPLHELGLHSSILSQWAKCQVSSLMKYDSISEAIRISVAHLITWGNVMEDEVLDYIKITESFTIRGCQHSFTTCNFAHLVANPFNFHTVTLMARQDVQVQQLRGWFTELAWIQRGRLLYGREPFKVIRFILPSTVIDSHGEWLQQIWDTYIPCHYTEGAHLQLETYDDPYPNLTQIDYDRLRFGLNPNDPPIKGSTYFCHWYKSPATHCLCAQIPIKDFEDEHRCSFNARNLPDENHLQSPGFGSLGANELPMNEEQSTWEIESQVRFEKMLQALFELRGLPAEDGYSSTGSWSWSEEDVNRLRVQLQLDAMQATRVVQKRQSGVKRSIRFDNDGRDNDIDSQVVEPVAAHSREEKQGHAGDMESTVEEQCSVQVRVNLPGTRPEA